MCAGGSCGAGTPLNCDDGNLCTEDSCNPASGCLSATAPLEGSVCGSGGPGTCTAPGIALAGNPAIPLSCNGTSDPLKCYRGTCVNTGLACGVDEHCGGTTDMTCGGYVGGTACDTRAAFCTTGSGSPMWATETWRCENHPTLRCNVASGGTNCTQPNELCVKATGYCQNFPARGCDGDGNGGLPDCPTGACIPGAPTAAGSFNFCRVSGATFLGPLHFDSDCLTPIV